LKLWIYTTFDCYLHYSYCMVKSNPNAGIVDAVSDHQTETFLEVW
jgi:hypothetical protein